MEHKKFQYNEYEEDVVRLSQYIFLETDLNEKHAIFNFHNQFTESIKSVNFVAIQFDNNDEVLNKTKLKYDGFEAKGNTFFVPKLKLLITEGCEKLEVYVEEATFDNYYLIDGVVHEISRELEYDEEGNAIEEKSALEHTFNVSKINRVGSTSLIVFTAFALATITLVLLYLFGSKLEGIF